MSSTLFYNDLFIFLMDDTQFWFHCETANPNCIKQCSNVQTKRNVCVKKQGEFANRVQKRVCEKMLSRPALVNLISSMKSKSRALIINGDLTDFGHADEMQRFRVNSADLAI